MATLLVLLALACRDTTGPGPTVLVSLVGFPSPRSVYFRYVGQQSGVVGVVPGSTVLSTPVAGDTTAVLVIAPLGQVLTGPIARVSVSDQAAALASDHVPLVQAASSDYQLQPTFQYVLTLQAPTP